MDWKGRTNRILLINVDLVFIIIVAKKFQNHFVSFLEMNEFIKFVNCVGISKRLIEINR